MTGDSCQRWQIRLRSISEWQPSREGGRSYVSQTPGSTESYENASQRGRVPPLPFKCR